MEHALAVITIATFVKDLVELGRKIKDSIDQVGENKEQLSKLRDEVTGTLDGLTRLAQGFNLNALPSLELLTALEDLKSHLESVHNKCNKASQHPSWFKSWWNRNKIDREIRRLSELKHDCHDQFTLFSATRTEGKVDRIADTTTQIQNTAVQITNTTTRIEAAAVQTAETTTRIEARTGQIRGTTARIENSTVLITDTTSRIEHTTDQVQVLALQQKLEKWLEHPPNMKRRQDDTQELQHEGTGAWFLGGDQFKGWKDKPGSLWIRGDSGTGKSVLSSTVIRELFSERQPRTAIAYFYFDFRDEKSQRVKIMLQSIILQLSAQSSNSYSALERVHESSQGQTLPTYNKLLGILEELLSDFTQTYIVLDALDECNEADHLVQFIARLQDWTTRPLHLLFTSQPRKIFAEPFEGALLVVLTPDITHQDIRRFINSELHSLSHLTRRICAEEIAEKVVVKSNGMFRLAALLLMELRDAFNPDLHAILTNFPDNLFGVYSRFLKRIHPTAVFYVSAVLRWLAFSSGPVTMACLEDALAFNFSNPSEFVYDLTRRGENADRVCKMLEGLIVVNQEWHFREGKNTRTVTLAHASVEDYFRSEKFVQEYPGYDLRVGPSHRFLAQTCLSYLLQFIDHPLIRKTRTDYPLGPHAAENWYYHLGRSDNPALLSSLVVRLLQDGSNQYDAFNNFRLHFWSPFRVTKPLNVCSELGYTKAVHFLLQNGTDPNLSDNGLSALIAASYAHLDIVRILLQSGARVDLVALEQARTHSRWDIVQALLQKSSISMVHNWITVELAIAFQGGRLEIAQLLLEAWTNLGGAQFPLHHPMVAASERGQSNIVRLLLEHGANVNAVTKNYNALCAASFHGHVEVIQVLLEKGAEVNAMSGRYGSALQAASVRGNIGICQLLIEHGAEVNTVGGEYGSALQAASVEGNLDICRLLVENGAGVNAAGGRFGSALQAASFGGNMEIVRLLLENGAEVNAADGEYGSALQAAFRGGNMEIFRLLLENGANVNVPGGRYGSALLAASFWSNMEIFRLLIKHGAEINATSALQAASRWGDIETVQLLVEHGAEVNTADGEHGSPLQAASRWGNVKICRLLLQYGADVNATGREHGSALRAASRNGHVDTVRLLLEKGADVNAFGGSALKAAARFGRLHPYSLREAEKITRILLEHGAHEEDMTAYYSE
ncbi:ankyrin repeat-containing domain protein [Mycena olivaceomarginata]|nr:ankyrin repeat-containing domain protein [Mycena olivaceomarginata]